MKKFLFGAALLLAIASNSSATSIDVRSLEQVFEETNIILFGRIATAGVGSCGGRMSTYAPYTLRVTKVLKGAARGRDIKICVESDLMLGSEVVIAGNRDSHGKIHAVSDAVVLVFARDSFYRMNPSESPVVQAVDREVYAIGTREPDMQRRFGKLLEGAGFWTESN